MTATISVATLIQHLLFLFLLIVAPIWDLYDTRRLKADPTSQRKIRHYKTLAAWLWIATFLACAAVGLRPLFTIFPVIEEIPWLWHHAWLNYLIQAIVAIFLATILLPVVVVALKKLKKQPRKYSSADAFKSLSYFLPATRTERRWWVFIALTAGICEEVLFRGFLLHYMHVFPWKLSLTLSLLVAAVIFGLQHLYQGLAGAASTVVVGLIFGLLFIFSGTLLLPIIFHAIMDLRLLVILRAPDQASA